MISVLSKVTHKRVVLEVNKQFNCWCTRSNGMQLRLSLRWLSSAGPAGLTLPNFKPTGLSTGSRSVEEGAILTVPFHTRAALSLELPGDKRTGFWPAEKWCPGPSRGDQMEASSSACLKISSFPDGHFTPAFTAPLSLCHGNFFLCSKQWQGFAAKQPSSAVIMKSSFLAQCLTFCLPLLVPSSPSNRLRGFFQIPRISGGPKPALLFPSLILGKISFKRNGIKCACVTFWQIRKQAFPYVATKEALQAWWSFSCMFLVPSNKRG